MGAYEPNDAVVEEFITRMESLPAEGWLAVFETMLHGEPHDETLSESRQVAIAARRAGAWAGAKAVAPTMAKGAVTTLLRYRRGETAKGPSVLYRHQGGGQDGGWAEQAAMEAVWALAVKDRLTAQQFATLYEPFADCIPASTLRDDRRKGLRGRLAGLVGR